MGKAIEANELRKKYPPDVQALDGFDLAVEEGTIFALLGPNGAGKSTAVKILTTLTQADSGEARVAGYDVRAHPDRVRRSIGVVGQKHGFDPEASGRENLVLQGALYDLAGPDLGRRVDQALERFDLTHAARRPVKTYSGGMQRRLDVAMGLLHSPQALFLDEPTTGLDPEARADMWRQIAALAADERMTILLTTHYLEEADELAAQVAIVDRGKIVAAGSPDELKSGMEGDTVHIELVDVVAGPDVELVLERLSELSEVSCQGKTVRTRARNGATAMPAALAALEAAGYPVASVAMARPSLDDVYLRYAGRSFREAESTDQQAA